MVRFFRLVLWPFERCAPELLLSAASLGGLLLVTGARAWSGPFWLDEVTTARLVDRGFWDIVIDRYAVAHSPLYFVLMKLWILLVSGPSGLHYPNEFWLRVPSLLAVGISGGLLAAAAWRKLGCIACFLLVSLWSLRYEPATPAVFHSHVTGLLLLAVASVGRAPRVYRRYRVANLLSIAVVFAWMTPRVICHTPGEQLALLEALKPEVITGGTTDTNFSWNPLTIYIPLRSWSSGRFAVHSRANKD